MELTVAAARIYFRDPKAVHNQIHKIRYHEQEVEKIGIRLLKSIFTGAYPLERKYHLRDHLVIFSSTSQKQFVTGLGLPPIPLVPVSSSQSGWRRLRYSFSARHKGVASNPLVGARKNSRGLDLHADQRGIYLLRDAVYRAKRLRTTGFYSSKRFERRFCAVNN
jgi:hypothetical protein